MYPYFKFGQPTLCNSWETSAIVFELPLKERWDFSYSVAFPLHSFTLSFCLSLLITLENCYVSGANRYLSSLNAYAQKLWILGVINWCWQNISGFYIHFVECPRRWLSLMNPKDFWIIEVCLQISALICLISKRFIDKKGLIQI
jgi:hypothetical protein